MRRKPSQPRRGYALLMTLLLLALATTATTATAVSCLREAALAASAQTDLQRRWGILSCQASVLPDAERLLEAKNVARVRQTVTLGGQTFELVVADEQAKLNVNPLLTDFPPRDAELAIRQALRAAGLTAAVALPAGLSPAQADAPRGGSKKRPVRAIDTLTPSAGPDELVGQLGRPGVTSVLTCWGDGRLNFRRATRDGLKSACTPALDALTIERLFQAARKNPKSSLAEALAGLELTDSQRQAAQELLTDQSEAHSLWVICDDGRRRWHELFILESGGPVRAYRW